MADKNHLRDTTKSPDIDSVGESSGVSTKLLEQLNSERLDQISVSLSKFTSTTTDTQPQTQKGGDMNAGFMSFLKWAGLSIPILLAIVGATTWIHSTIDSKVRESRMELKSDIDSNRMQLKADIEASKLELKTEAIRTQDAVNRLDDKMDRKLDKLSDQLSTMQQDFKNQK